MSKPVHRDAPFDILLLAAGFLIVFMFGLRTVSGADIWFHLSAGRNAVFNGAATIDPFAFSLPPGTEWIQTTWLYDVLMYKLWKVGGSAVAVLIHAAAVIGTFLLLLPVCRKYSGQLHQAAALLVAAWLMAPLMTLRPMLFCLLFLAAHINILSRQRISVIGAVTLVASQLLWANMHPSFVLGILLTAVRTWEAFGRRNTDEAGPKPMFYAILLAAVALAPAANPAGFRLYGEGLKAALKPQGGVMLEWISPFFSDFMPIHTGFVTTLALILIAAVFIFFRGRLPAVPTACAILSAFLMVRSHLTLELCAVLAFPYLAMSFSIVLSLAERLKSETSRRAVSWGAYTAVSITAAVTAWMVLTNRYYVATGSAAAIGVGVNTDAYPVAALSFIQEDHDLPARTLNIAQDGGFMLWRRPDRKIFSDPRGDLYGGVFFQQLAKGLLGNPKHWNDLVTRYDPEGVLLNCTWTGSGTVVYHLVNQGDWVIAYFDGTTALLARRTASNRALIEDEELQKKGLNLIDQSYARYMKHIDNPVIRPPNPSRLIGAGAVLQALGRHNESIKIFEALTKGTPRMATAWVNLGIAQASTGDNASAVESLEKALTLLPANPIALLWLSEAYRDTDRGADAAMTLDQARRINPQLAEKFGKAMEAEAMFQPPSE